MANPIQLTLLRQGVEEWNKWRKEKWRLNLNLIEADLSGADLSAVDLSEVHLSDANLRRASFADANLGEACLNGANLEGANLQRANCYLSHFDLASLAGASLCYADLRNANIRGADLCGADLSSSDLDDADFSRAKFGETTLVDVDLSKAKGLETCQHVAPSSIGLDTFFRSKGKIPDCFLRGCGVPEHFITYSRSLVSNPIEFYSCFISYSHADKPFARRLHDTLQGRGIRCWLDEKQLLPGDDIYEQVDHGIRLWDKVLLCCSEKSLNSWWVDNEIDKAFQKEQMLMRERQRKILALIPLNLDGYLLKGWENGKASQVRSRMAADFQGWDQSHSRFEEQVDCVVRALRSDVAAREVPPTSRL